MASLEGWGSTIELHPQIKPDQKISLTTCKSGTTALIQTVCYTDKKSESNLGFNASGTNLARFQQQVQVLFLFAIDKLAHDA